MELTFDNAERVPGWQLIDAAVAYLRAFTEGQHVKAPRLPTADRARNPILRAAQPPLGVPGDGSDVLVQQAIAAYMSHLPASAFAAMSALAGMQLNASSHPSIPVRTGATMPGAFVQPGGAIPVLSATMASVPLVPAKCAGILVMTRELVRAASISVFETLLGESVRFGVDSVFLGSAAAGNGAPAGIGAGATAFPGSDNVSADVLGMLAALPDAVAPTFIVNHANAAAMLAKQLPGAAQVVIAATMSNDSAYLLDAADLAVGIGANIELQRTDEAAIHLANPAAAIVDGAGTLATPVQSLWQHDLVGLLTLIPATWAVRDASRVILASGISWTAAPVTP